MTFQRCCHRFASRLGTKRVSGCPRRYAATQLDRCRPVPVCADADDRRVFRRKRQACDHRRGSRPRNRCEPDAACHGSGDLSPSATRRAGFARMPLDRCPPGAACSIVQLLGFVKQSVGLSDGLWQRQVTQTLECAPAHGTYADPEATCRAPFDLTHRMAKNRVTACSCPLGTAIAAMQPRVVGVINGRRTVLHLDACTVCSLGPEAAHDVTGTDARPTVTEGRPSESASGTTTATACADGEPFGHAGETIFSQNANSWVAGGEAGQ